MIAGAVIAVPGIVVMVLAFLSVVFGTTYEVPDTVQLHLEAGRYAVFENTATTRSYGVLQVTNGRGISIDASQVTVTSDDGSSVVVRDRSPNQTITRSSDHYVAAVEFTTPHAGDYDVRFDTTVETKVMVEPPMGEVFSRRVPWLVAIGIGWLVAVAGAAMLIIGSTRRGRVEREAARQAAASVSPAQWYADPLGERRLRYWDGSQWTDHTAD